MELSRLLDGSTPSTSTTEKKEEQTKDKVDIQQISDVSPERKLQMEREHPYLRKSRTRDNLVEKKKRYIEYDVFFF